MNWDVNCAADSTCQATPVVIRDNKPPVCINHSKTGIKFPPRAGDYKMTEYFNRKLND